MSGSDLAARVERESSAVAFLRDQLVTLGQSEADYLDISIESETGFREMIEELLEHEAEADANIQKIKARKDELTVRQERYAQRKLTFRTLIASALEAAGLHKQETAFGTVSLSSVAPKAVVVDEAEVPTRFWKPSDPTLDRKALTDELRRRAKALDEAGALTDPAEREAAVARVAADFPAIPGASLGNGCATITIRRR